MYSNQSYFYKWNHLSWLYILKYTVHRCKTAFITFSKQEHFFNPLIWVSTRQNVNVTCPSPRCRGQIVSLLQKGILSWSVNVIKSIRPLTTVSVIIGLTVVLDSSSLYFAPYIYLSIISCAQLAGTFSFSWCVPSSRFHSPTSSNCRLV